MMYHGTLAAGILAIALLVQPGLAQSSDQPSPSRAEARQPDQISLYIQAIEQAPDPSAAITAYARGAALDSSSRKLLEAYVDRMIDFDLPETAYHQAQVLVEVDPTNGQAWAVLSYVNARRGQMSEAFADLAQAASLEPDNVFVQSTAGQLLAWYDKNQPAVPDSLKNSLEKVRREMAGQKAYTETYAQAQGQLRQQPAVQPSQEQYAAGQYGTQGYAAPSYDGMYAPSAGYGDSGDYYSPYYSLYYPLYPYSINYPGYYPFYYYPSLAYSDWWWPYGPFFGSSFFFGFSNSNFFFNHHHFHDFDDFFFHRPFRDHFAFNHRGFDFDGVHGRRGIFDHGRFGHGRDFVGGHGFADRGRGGFDVGRGGFQTRHDVSRSGASRLGPSAMTSDRLGLAAPGAGGRTFGRTDALGSRTFRSGAGTRTQTGISRTDVSRSQAMAQRGMGSSGGISRGTSNSAGRSAISRGFSTPSRGFGSPGMSTRSFSAPSRGFSGGGTAMRSFGGSPSRGFSSGGMRSSGFSGGGTRSGISGGGMRGGFGGGMRSGGGFGGGMRGGGMAGGHGGGGHR